MKVSEIVENSKNINRLIQSLKQKEDAIRIQTPVSGFCFICDDLQAELKSIIAKQALLQIKKLSLLGIDDFSGDIEFLESFLKGGDL